jgi:hypothetical protein
MFFQPEIIAEEQLNHSYSACSKRDLMRVSLLSYSWLWLQDLDCFNPAILAKCFKSKNLLEKKYNTSRKTRSRLVSHMPP